jgi:hypothetical protein
MQLNGIDLSFDNSHQQILAELLPTILNNKTETVTLLSKAYQSSPNVLEKLSKTECCFYMKTRRGLPNAYIKMVSFHHHLQIFLVQNILDNLSF